VNAKTKTRSKKSSSGVTRCSRSDAHVHRVSAAASSLSNRRHHEGAAQPVTPSGGGDIELREITLEAAAPDRGAEPQHRQAVRALADEENDRVVTLEQPADAVGQLLDGRCRLVELAVEVVEQLRDDASVRDVRASHR
jgi:hypothetical protein